jgi:hypothetical protein
MMLTKSEFSLMFFSMFFVCFSFVRGNSPTDFQAAGRVLKVKIVKTVEKLINGKESLTAAMIKSSMNATEVLLKVEEFRALFEEGKGQENFLKNEQNFAKRLSWHVVAPMENMITNFRRFSKVLASLIEESLDGKSIVGDLMTADQKAPISSCLYARVYDMKTLKQFCREIIKLEADFEVTFVNAFKKGHGVLDKKDKVESQSAAVQGQAQQSQARS